MNGINKVMLFGQLAREPEIRSTQNGTHIANLSIGTPTSYKKDGEWKTFTDYHRVVTYNDFLVEQAQKLHKGDTVYVEGTLKTRKWTDKEGKDQYVTEVVLEPYKGVLQQMGEGTMADRGYTPRGTSRPQARKQDLDDEIPF